MTTEKIKTIQFTTTNIDEHSREDLILNWNGFSNESRLATIKCDNEILPYLVGEKEMKVYSDCLSHANKQWRLLFIDRRLSKGGFVLENEQAEVVDLKKTAFENLVRRLGQADFVFERAGHTNLYRLNSDLMVGAARSIIFLENVRNQIKNRYGKECIILISDTENLYVHQIENDLEQEIDNLDSFPEANYELKYTVFLFDEAGRFIELGEVKR